MIPFLMAHNIVDTVKSAQGDEDAVNLKPPH